MLGNSVLCGNWNSAPREPELETPNKRSSLYFPFGVYIYVV